MTLHCSRSCRIGCGNGGFTLMELIVVLLLVGLLMSFAMPTLRNTVISGSLEKEARKLIGAVTEVRQLAVREHGAYLLHFDLDNGRYWYEKDGAVNPFGEEPQTTASLSEEVKIKAVETRKDGSVGGGEIVLWISNKGYMDQTTVHLRDTAEKEVSLRFSPFSSSARIIDGGGGGM